MLFSILKKISKATRVPIGGVTLAFCLLAFITHSRSVPMSDREEFITGVIWGVTYIFAWIVYRDDFWNRPD